MKSLFVAGTDTGVGKTRITTAMMHAIQQKGLLVMGMKPVATGCIWKEEGLRNPDAELILSCCGKNVPYELVNPYAFEPPVSPLFAAQAMNVRIIKETICDAFRDLSNEADTVIVEGIGGWRMPLGAGLQMSDLAGYLQLEVILVVGLRLGCINHALLSAEAIRHDGIKLSGWVANQVDPDYELIGQTMDVITKCIQAPLLGQVPYQDQNNNLVSVSCLSPDRLEMLMGEF